MKADVGLLLAVGLLGGCAGNSGTSVPQGAVGAAAPAPQSSGELTAGAGLADLLRYSEEHNPGLRAAQARWHAARARAPQARALPDPQLAYSIESTDGSRQDMLTLGQAIPWPGKLQLAGGVADQEAEAERQRYQAARLALAYRVKNAWHEHWYLARAVEVAAENLQLARSVEETTRARYKAAAADFSDVLKAQVELSRTEDLVRELEGMRGPVSARLNAELDRPAEAPLPAPASAPPNERLSVSDREVLALLGQTSPDLAAMDAEVRAAQDSARLARRGPIPDLMLEAGPTFMKEPGEERNTGVTVGVGLTIPLWFGKYRSMRQEADARLAAAEFSRREAANRLGTEVKMALFGLRDADRKASLYRDTIIPRAEQALETARAAYQAGKARFGDLLDAQRMLLQFRLDRHRALANRAQRMAELEMLVGRELPKEAGHE